MKPITGSVLSSKAVSVKKSASILSRFVASETGAHQDVAGFLKRTSEAADELVQFYGCLLAAKDDSGPEMFEEEDERKIEDEEEATREEGGKRSEKKKKKKKKRKERKEEADAEADRNLEHGEIEDDARTIRVYENGGAAGVVALKSEKTSRKEKRRSGDETEGVGGKTVEAAGDESNANEKKSKRKKKRKEKGDAIEVVAEGGEEHPPAKKRKFRKEP